MTINIEIIAYGNMEIIRLILMRDSWIIEAENYIRKIVLGMLDKCQTNEAPIIPHIHNMSINKRGLITNIIGGELEKRFFAVFRVIQTIWESMLIDKASMMTE